MLDPYVTYAVLDNPDQYELFGDDHISLGFQNQEYIKQYNIPLCSRDYQQREYIKRWAQFYTT